MVERVLARHCDSGRVEDLVVENVSGCHTLRSPRPNELQAEASVSLSLSAK